MNNQNKTHNILVVEDDLDIREIIVDDIESRDFNVFEASDGKEALQILSTESFEFLVTDLIMPEEDGLVLIRKVRIAYPNLRIIAVSGGSKFMEGSYLNVATTMGADRALEKPLRPGIVGQTITELLAS